MATGHTGSMDMCSSTSLLTIESSTPHLAQKRLRTGKIIYQRSRSVCVCMRMRAYFVFVLFCFVFLHGISSSRFLTDQSPIIYLFICIVSFNLLHELNVFIQILSRRPREFEGGADRSGRI